MTNFTLQSYAENGARLQGDGTMTIYNAADIKDKLIAAVRENEALEVDLSCIAEMDTAGFQLLVLAKHESQRLNHTLRITSHSDAVREMVEFYGMTGFFGDPLVIPATAEKE